MDERLLAEPVRGDEHEGLAAERRHLLHRLVQHQLGLVKVKILAHVVLVLPFLPPALESE